MSFWTLLDGGMSMPQRNTLGQRFALWWGYKLAARHRRVSVDPSCCISPQARVCPRQGAIKIGAHSSVALGVLLQGNVTIGIHCSVQAYAVLIGYGSHESPGGLVKIGDFVRIAPSVMMIAANHIFDDAIKPIRKQGLAHAPITIEDDVWIGGRVTILAGVKVGEGSVVGAGAVVTKDIPPYSIAVGVPAKVIKRRN
jgi:acetyltransferase-like isoleucine patch superfamily enzyme